MGLNSGKLMIEMKEYSEGVATLIRKATMVLLEGFLACAICI